MPTSNVTSITDLSDIYLKVVHEGETLLIKKTYIETYIDPDDPNIVLFKFHWYERNVNPRLFYLDFNRVTSPATASAVALKAAIDAMLITQFAGSADETYWKPLMLGGM